MRQKFQKDIRRSRDHALARPPITLRNIVATESMLENEANGDNCDHDGNVNENKSGDEEVIEKVEEVDESNVDGKINMFEDKLSVIEKVSSDNLAKSVANGLKILFSEEELATSSLCGGIANCDKGEPNSGPKKTGC